MSMWPLLLLPLYLAAAAVADAGPPSPPPPITPWPEQYHAVVITNLTGGRLRVIDIYYDWPRRRDLNLVIDQLSGEPPLRNVEWANGTAFLFDAASCQTFQADVGLLPPDWKKAYGGATYLGRRRLDGFDCHVWSNFLFEQYYEDVNTGFPVAWNYFGSMRHVLSFEVGGVPEDDSTWQAPAYCFDGSNGDGQGIRADVVDTLISFAGPGLRRQPHHLASDLFSSLEL